MHLNFVSFCFYPIQLNWTLNCEWRIIAESRWVFHLEPLYGVGENNTKIFFFFIKLRYCPFGFNPENFANIWQIRSVKLDKIDEVWKSANAL